MRGQLLAVVMGWLERVAAALDLALVLEPVPLEDADLTAAQPGAQGERHFIGDGVAVARLLSDEDRTSSGERYVIGCGATRSKRTPIGDWRIVVADGPSAPPTLSCQLPVPGCQEKTWVIAAADADECAEAARLTSAATAVTFGMADLADTVYSAGFDVLFERIRKQILGEGGHVQERPCTPVIGARSELGFSSIHGTGPAGRGARRADDSTSSGPMGGQRHRGLSTFTAVPDNGISPGPLTRTIVETFGRTLAGQESGAVFC